MTNVYKLLVFVGCKVSIIGEHSKKKNYVEFKNNFFIPFEINYTFVVWKCILIINSFTKNNSYCRLMAFNIKLIDSTTNYFTL